MDNFVSNLCKKIDAAIEEECSIQCGENTAVLTSMLNAGVQGTELTVDVSERVAKVKTSKEYKYPISDSGVEQFQEMFTNKYEGYTAFVSGQLFSISRFFTIQGMEDAEKNILEALDVIRAAVPMFEEMCVNFMDEQGQEEKEEYDPEKAVDVVNVDNEYRVLSTTQSDNEEFEQKHLEYAEKLFKETAERYGASIKAGKFNASLDGEKKLRCKIRDDGDIDVSVSIKADRDAGTMYASYIKPNFQELKPSYSEKFKEFTVKAYVTPDEFMPMLLNETIEMCVRAIDLSVNEFQKNMKKKDTVEFASDVQALLKQQADAVSEKEKAVAKRETEIAKQEEALKQQSEEYKKKLKEMDNARKKLEETIIANDEKLKAERAKMKAEIEKYEKRNSQDILNMQQLAKQVAELQDRINSDGTADSNDEEIYRLNTKLKQVTAQRVAMEKALNEKITSKDAKIRNMNEAILEKNAELQKMQESMEVQIQARVSEENKKTDAMVAEMKKELEQHGKLLQPEDIMEYYGRYYDVKKLSAPGNAVIVAYKDEETNIFTRIRFSEINFVEVYRAASIGEKDLQKLNSKFGDIKFFAKSGKVIARAYFPVNATCDQVDELVNRLTDNFAK